MNSLSTSHLLVLQSITYVVILGIVLLFYYFVFPKKKLPLFILFILIACLPLLSMLRQGPYESGDFSIHVMEEIFFYKVLGQGNIFPLWGGEMNASYGYPSFLFTYPLPFYVMAFFHSFGFSFINSAKLLLASSYLFSGVFMYLWLKKEVGNKAAFVGGLLYLFAPYHLVDLHFRADIGEMLSFVFFPLTLLAVRNYIQKKTVRWLLLEVISMAALILSHPAISLVGFFVLSCYILLLSLRQSQRIKLIAQQVGVFIFAVLLTTFYWLPVLFELRFTYHAQFMKKLSFVKWHELIYSPWQYGFLFQGHYGELSYAIGYAHLLILFLAIVFIFRKKYVGSEKTVVLLSLFLFGFFTFMMFQTAKPLWYLIPFISNFQFSYRLLGIVMFLTSVIAAYVIYKIKKDAYIIILCLFIIFSTILNWGNRKNLATVNDYALEKQIPFTATNGGGINQAITIWSDPRHPYASNMPKYHTEIISGAGSVEEIKRTNTKHIYQVDAHTNLIVRENTLYFPGWHVLSDGKEQKITILQTASPSGIISFHLPSGHHIVEVIFQDTFVVRFAKIISLIAVLTLLCFAIISFRKNK